MLQHLEWSLWPIAAGVGLALVLSVTLPRWARTRHLLKRAVQLVMVATAAALTPLFVVDPLDGFAFSGTHLLMSIGGVIVAGLCAAVYLGIFARKG